MSGCGCGGACGCGGHEDSLSGWLLGAIDAATAAAQVIGSDSHVNASSRSAIQASAGAGVMLDAAGNPAYIPGTVDCAAVSSPGSTDLKLAQTASGLALTGVQIGLTASGAITGAALAPFTMGISAIIGLFPMIFGHHAQAVKQEQDVLCTAVPAANNYLQIIDQAVQSGAASPQDGMSALDSLYSDFQSQVASIRNDCNAACVMGMELAAIVAVKKSEYQDLITGAQQTVTPSRPNTTAPQGTAAPASSYSSFYSAAPPTTSTPTPNIVPAATTTMPSYAPSAISAVPPVAASPAPSWLPIAAIGIGAILLLRGL